MICRGSGRSLVSRMHAAGVREISVVLTCEHAGNRVPTPLKAYFRSADAILQSHRGWDPGALPLARRFASHLKVPLAFSIVSRLVVELNRSLRHPRLFSEFTSRLPETERLALIEKYWQPHRRHVTDTVAALVRAGRVVVHLSVHTFTEHYEGEVRTTDIGLLYDPRRQAERQFCSHWRDAIIEVNPAWQIRRNDPYKGSSDGFTTSLRREFPADQYLGLELEVCQKFFLSGSTVWTEILRTLPRSFSAALKSISQ